MLARLSLTLVLLAAGAAALPAAADARGSRASRSATASTLRIVVAPYGSDGATGSVAHPLATVQRAIDRLPRGGTIQLRGGLYAQRFAFDHDADITVEPYHGELPVLDGTDLPVPNGMSGLVTIANSDHITIDGLDLTGYHTSSMKATPVGIYVHGGDVGVTLTHNHIHDMGNDNRTLGDFDYNALGIAVYGDSPRHPVSQLAIDDNTVDHLSTGASETVTMNGNVDHWQVERNQIDNDDNIGIDAIGYEPTLSGRYRYTDRNRARDGVIADNVINHIYSSENPAYQLSYKGRRYSCDCADGVYVDGGTRIVIERNSVSRADIGIEVASEHPHGSASHVIVRDNFVWDSKATGISTGGYCDDHTDCGGGGLARPGDRVQTGASFDNAFVNNTLYNNNTLHDGGPQVLIQYYAHDNLFENNLIVAGPGQQLELGTVPRAGTDGRTQGNVVDHNFYYSASGRLQDARFGWLGTTYSSWAAYRQAAGQESHSSFVDPQLIDLPLANLHLTAGSPAINAGATLPLAILGRVDIDHQARMAGGGADIGADEYQGAPTGPH